MQITISNYNNIRNLDYEIEDSKINFLFGISGCGKSSIAKALTKKVQKIIYRITQKIFLLLR